MPATGANIASYMTIADGNVSSGSNWALIDSISQNEASPTTDTGTVTDLTAGTNTTTAYVKSSTWAYASSPPTIDGIAVRIVSNTGVGTFTMCLDLSNVDVTGTTVTCNVSDLPANGWVFLKFSASVTLTVATYSLKVKSSTNSSVNIGIISSAGNWCRFLRTTSTGTAPSAGSTQRDNMYIMGEVTGAGTTTSRTMTWDITVNTNPYNMLSFCSYSTTSLENNVSTNYYMHIQVDIRITAGATLNIGTSGTPVQGTFTLTYHNTTSNVLALLVNVGGTFNVYGTTKGTVKTTLASNVAAAGTSISVAAATNWAVGDMIVLAPTTTTSVQGEVTTISSISGTTIGVGALTYAHLGTSPKIAEVINLTRNVLFKGISTTATGCIAVVPGGNLLMRYVEMRDICGGYNVFGGLYLQSSGTASCDIQYCSLYSSVSGGGQADLIGIGTLSGTGSVIFSNNVVWRIGAYGLTVQLSTTQTGTLTVDGNVFIGNGYINSNTSMIYWGLGTGLGSFTNNSMSGASVTTPNASVYIPAVGPIGTFSGNTIHSSSSYGVNYTPAQTTVAPTFVSSSWTIWCVDTAVMFYTQLIGINVNLNGLTAFSNTTSHIAFNNNIMGAGAVYFNNLQLQAGTVPVTTSAIRFAVSASITQVAATIENSNIGDVSAHTLADLNLGHAGLLYLTMRNTKLGSSTQLNSIVNFIADSFISSDRHQQASGNFQLWLAAGILTRDTILYSTASPSIRGTPNNASSKLAIGSFFVAVTDGSTPSVSIKVRRSLSSTGDSATYNGNLPRLMLAMNNAAGITSLTVLATATSASSGAWETLTATLPAPTGDNILQLYIDCDGTVGWVNVDDFTTTQVTSNQGGLSFSRGGQSFCTLGNGNNATVTVNAVIPIIRRKVM